MTLNQALMEIIREIAHQGRVTMRAIKMYQNSGMDYPKFSKAVEDGFRLRQSLQRYAK